MVYRPQYETYSMRLYSVWIGYIWSVGGVPTELRQLILIEWGSLDNKLLDCPQDGPDLYILYMPTGSPGSDWGKWLWHSQARIHFHCPLIFLNSATGHVCEGSWLASCRLGLQVCPGSLGYNLSSWSQTAWSSQRKCFPILKVALIIKALILIG